MTLSRATRRVLLGLLGVAFVSGALYAWRSGAITPASVRVWLESLGPAAPLIFIGAFVGSAFCGLPGMVFVIGARLAFGPVLGFSVSMIGGLLALTAPFLIARRVRRSRAATAPWRPKNRHLARALGLVERYPFRAVFVLRLVLWFNSPLSYALAYTPIRFMTYLAACACALAPVVAVAMVATSWFLGW